MASNSWKMMGKLAPKIIIIGAGISGISAAERLMRQGFDEVLLLEGSDRIGGRIKTRNLGYGEGWVEEGAQWIHGEDDNVAYDYAVKHGLLSDKSGSYELTDELFYLEDGRAIDPSLCANMCAVLSEKLEHGNESLSMRHDVEHMTVDRYLDEEIREELNRSGSQEEAMLKMALVKWFKRFQCSIEGCDSLSELSLRSFVHYTECEGNQLTNLKQGYTSLVESLATRIPKENILMHRTVDRIEIVDCDRHAVRVKCRDGSVYEADHVIVTVSLGVLKCHVDDMFEPPLSATKREAIRVKR